MYSVEVTAGRCRTFPGARGQAQRIVKSVLRSESADYGCGTVVVGVNFIDDSGIAAMNRKWKKRRGPTDVLSFNFNEEQGRRYFLGEIYISMDTLRRQAIQGARNGVVRELGILLIHGTLHLLGHEHNAGMRKRAVMAKKEEYYRAHLLKGG